jgi:excisionase family DNA binding protein
MLDKVATTPPVTLADVMAELKSLRALVEGFARSVRNADGDELSVPEAAALAGVSQQCIRNWCARHGIGVYDSGSFRYRISRAKLEAHLRPRHHGEV